MPVYALTSFLGAFLLFQVQPLIGKYILPWFGGGPGVWTTCLMFFQVLLLGGYAYADLTTRWLKPRTQAVLHLALLAAAVASLPIRPTDAWKPQGENKPVIEILVLLTCNLGVPYFVLATTGPLVQHWFSKSSSRASPYRLYALSNLGSLLALISYPLFFESCFSRRAQAELWAYGLAAYAFACAVCVLKSWARRDPNDTHASSAEQTQNPPDTPLAPGPVRSRARQALWILLPASASTLLLGITNKLCLDVAAFPLLWVVPLALYLLSFVICFENPRWYRRLPCAAGLVIALSALTWAQFSGTRWPLWVQVSVYSTGLFVCCLVCHGELFRLRPDPAQLTGFYLLVAAGGALGGLFVSLIAPLVFSNYYELHWGLFMCGLLVVTVWTVAGTTLPSEASSASRAQRACRADGTGKWSGQDWRQLGSAVMWLAVLAFGATLWLQTRPSNSDVVHKSRNFYGVLTVFEHRRQEPNGHHFLLQHGRITHGFQFADSQLGTWPTTYYGPESGVGLALNALPAGGRSIGVVGLGTGTLAAYARAGDCFRFYEINPEIKRLATTRFTYLAHSLGHTEIILGDARLSMEREPPQDYDLLALDAFSSDAIPVHLLTKEAFDTYARHLKPKGVIAVHISNHFLDLEPVVVSIARQFNFHLAVIDYEENEEQWWLYSSTWVLLSRDEQVLKSPRIRAAAEETRTQRPTVRLWTDDFSSLFQILRLASRNKSGPPD